MKIIKLCPFCGNDSIKVTKVQLEPFYCRKCKQHFLRPVLFASEMAEMKKIIDNIAKTNKKLGEIKTELHRLGKNNFDGFKNIESAIERLHISLSDLFKE